ncbi:unnamed protein product, partial [marine sediment metagenome]
PDLIEGSRQKVAQDFLAAQNGAYHSLGKFGIWSLDTERRFGVDEQRWLKLELFRTDYFTHRVMREVYAKLVAADHKVQHVDLKDLATYRCLLTSFGLNAVVFLERAGERDIMVLCERSPRAADVQRPGLFHVTMNEGLSHVDVDPDTGIPSLALCLQRGLMEELHLASGVLTQRMTADFLDVFLLRSRLELGITCSVRISDMTFEQFHETASTAKDRELEIRRVVPIPFDRDAVESFLHDHDMISHGRYAVHMIAPREGLFLR